MESKKHFVRNLEAVEHFLDGSFRFGIRAQSLKSIQSGLLPALCHILHLRNLNMMSASFFSPQPSFSEKQDRDLRLSAPTIPAALSCKL